jgi:hypothetical protein
MTDARKNERVTINKEFDSFAQFIEEYVSVVGGFSPAPAEQSSAGPHPLVWGPGPKPSMAS